jgi:carbonic anhydrase
VDKLTTPLHNKKLEDEGKIKIVGAIYDISNGKIFLI